LREGFESRDLKFRGRGFVDEEDGVVEVTGGGCG